MTRDPAQPARQFATARSLVRRAAQWWWVAYLIALGASHLLAYWGHRDQPTRTAGPGETSIEMSAMSDQGAVAGRTMRLAYREWPAPRAAAPPAGAGRAEPPPTVPIILLHGSPGTASNFGTLAPLLSAAGYRVIAPDLPGYGDSSRDIPSYSIRAHAHAVLALLDRLGIERAHVVGWSLGGGVALNMADLQPRRLASLTMLASVGDQSVEGSGSYELEHLKYLLGYAIFVVGPELVPHFGLLEDDGFARSSLKNFYDSDMRPLRAIMQRLDTPVLVLHGRHDFLVPDWAAEHNAALIPTSKLVMLDASHFLPFLQPDQAAEHILEFTRRHDAPAVAPLRCELSFAPRPPHVFGVVGTRFDQGVRATPWWVLLAILSLLAARAPYATLSLVTVLVLGLEIDLIVGALGLALGWAISQPACVLLGRLRGARPGAPGAADGVPGWLLAGLPRISTLDWSRRFDHHPPGIRLALAAVFRHDRRVTAPLAIGALRRPPWVYLAAAAVAGCLWVGALLLPCLIAAALLVTPLKFALGAVGIMLLWAIIRWLAINLVLVFTWTGRRQLAARVRRFIKHEYWPTWIFYIPVVPYLAYLTIKHRHPLAFTACNPGIDAGGGVVGESKSQILRSFASANGFLLETVRIDPHESAEHRAAVAAAAIAASPALGFPVILKPDQGFRGFGVRLARSHSDVLEYLREMTRPVILQAYHPGPHEVGVLWSRHPRADGNAVSSPSGFIYSITRKEFPHVVGDGRRTLEELVYAHPRLRCQAPVFMRRFADEASRVPRDGERIRLAQSGNHCQGTLFRDGSDLITPELVARIDELARGFARRNAEAGAVPATVNPGSDDGLDFGRFDVRYASEDDLRAGHGFGIVELNGTTGESTNLYDPDRSLLWSYKVLYGQWRLLYELGALRRAAGAELLTVRDLFASIRRYYRRRPGSPVAD